MTPQFRDLERAAKKLGLRESIRHLWIYSLHVGYGWDLPFEYSHSRPGSKHYVNKHIYEFHLDLHVREIFLHAGSSRTAQRNLGDWDHLADFHNAIHACCDTTSAGTSDIYLNIHRMGHQQIGNFDAVNHAYIGRYWSLFKRAPMEPILHSAYGMTAAEYLLLVMGIFTLYTQRYEWNPSQALSPLEIPALPMDQTLAKFVATPAVIRREALRNARYDESWEYTFNPVTSKPLVQLSSKEPGLYACPRPQLLVRRMLAGSFFDLVNVPGYATAVGDASEELVGDLIRKASPNLGLHKPLHYLVGKNLRHGCDWIAFSTTSDIFIECKSARISLEAKVAKDAEDVERGMKRLADAVAQNYSNINDVLLGRSGYSWRNCKAYALVVTLEDWVLFSPTASSTLLKLVEEKVIANGLPLSILQAIPYTVLSVRDLPDLMAACEDEGIEAVMEEKNSDKFRPYMISGFLSDTNRKRRTARNLFTQETEFLLDLFRERSENKSQLGS